MRTTYVSGVAMTPFTKTRDSLWTLASDAAAAALEDANLPPDRIDAFYVANAVGGPLTGQHMIKAQVIAKQLGLAGVPMVNTENACASGATALSLAADAMESARYENVLVLGAESLSPVDRQLVNAAMATGVDIHDLEAIQAKHGTQAMFMGLYAEQARDYMEATGATVADFARVTAKNSRHGALNPKAQYREPLTVENVLSARHVNDLLTLPMCAPISDGAAAVVLRAEAQDEGHRPVRLLASVLATGGDDEPAARRAARVAFERAGVTAGDITHAEMHDATAPGELIAVEQVGLCVQGEGPADLERGDFDLGGRLPVNTSGGLLRKGHPLAATGIAQIVELTLQIRGRAGERQVAGAEVGLAHNAGGYWDGDVAACAISIVAAA